MQQIRLGNAVSLSRIVQGYWRLTNWNWTPKELAAHMNACLERGVTSFDTAEVYGRNECERQIGLALKEDKTLRPNMQIVSKTGIFHHSESGVSVGYYDTSYERIMQSCKESIARMGCETIDLYLIHREDPALDPWEAARALKDLKKAGLIRAAGVSNFDPHKFRAIDTAMDGEVVTNQIEWNPICFEHFNSGMMDLLLELRVHPMIWSPLAGGDIFTRTDETAANVRKVLEPLAEKYDTTRSSIVYAWLLAHPAGAIPICGSNKMDRLEEAIRSLDIHLARWEWYQIYTASGQQVLR